MEGLRYCPNCSGSGKDWKEKVQIPCSYCGGKKYVGPIAEAAERVEVIGDATLIQADCLKVLPLLGKVDAVICDPPYGMNKDIANDAPEVADALVADAMATCKRITLGNVLAFWSAQRLGVIEGVFQPKRTMIWNKTFAIYAPHNVGYRYEPLVWVAGKEAANKRGDIFEAFPIAFKAQAENAAHPTQKPLALIEEILRDFTAQGDLVLDPFMGSGTTGVACLKLGRRFIGIEIESKYFDIAVSRIREAHKQPDIFLEAERKATQSDFLTDLINAGDAA